MLLIIGFLALVILSLWRLKVNVEKDSAMWHGVVWAITFGIALILLSFSISGVILRCPNCKTLFAMDEDAQYCGYCGHDFHVSSRYCMTCNEKTDKKYCTQCGEETVLLENY